MRDAPAVARKPQPSSHTVRSTAPSFAPLKKSKPFLVSPHVAGFYVEGYESLLPQLIRVKKPAAGTHPGVVGKENKDIFGDGELVEKNQFKTGFMRYLWHPRTKPLISESNIEFLSTFLLEAMTEGSSLWKQPAVRSPSIPTCWLVSQAAGDYSVLHTHSPAVVSGVFYLACPSGINARTFPDGILSVLDDSEVVAIPPIAGLLLVWPGELPHMVYPFRGLGRRMLLSWNLQQGVKI